MKISLNNDAVINISDYVGDIWLTNKLDGQWMYGTLPEKILPKIEGEKATFFLSNKYRKYGDVWQINNGQDNVDIDILSKNIILLNKNPIQFKIIRDQPIQDIKVLRVNDEFIQLSRPLLESEFLIVKRRVNTNYGDAYFSKNWVCPLLANDKSKFKLNISEMIDSLNIIEGDIVDFFIKNSAHEEKLSVNQLPGDWFTDTRSKSKYRIYQTAANALAIYFYSEKSIYINKVTWSKSNLIITLAGDFLAKDISNLEISESTRKSSNSSIRISTPIIGYADGQDLIINDDLLKSELSRRKKFGFRILFSYKNSIIKNQFRTKHSESLISDSDFELHNISGKNFLSLELTRKKKDDAIKIAVLGSSHTRPMFRSDKYFNPNYKNIYEVVYTQFHSSIISLVSDGREYEDMYYKTRNNTVRKYIKTDFEKNFFKELEKSKPDFLLIDIYIDVQMGVIYFRDGSVISYNSYQAESNYVLDHIDDVTKLSTIFTDDGYIEKFSNALKTFKKRILGIIPENRIIIHSFDMSEDYKDDNNEIQQYSQKKGSIVELNEIAVSMQFLLENTFPKANILDIRDSPYHGGIDNPIGNMPHHFESGYYAALMNELNKVILSVKK